MDKILITSVIWMVVSIVGFAVGFCKGYEKKRKESERLCNLSKEELEDEIVEKAKLIHRRRKALPKQMIKRKELCKK